MIPINDSSNEMKYLAGLPPIAQKYILANFACNWQGEEIDFIRNQIMQQCMPILKEHVVNYTTHIYILTIKIINVFQFIHHKVDRFTLISILMPDNTNFEQFLQSKNIGKSIPLNEQANILLSDTPMNGSCVQPMKIPSRNIHTRNLNAARPLQSSTLGGCEQPSSTIQNKSKKMILDHISNQPAIIHQRLIQRDTSSETATPVVHLSSTPVFRANELPPGSHQVVYVSYFADGPYSFYIHLKNQEATLLQLMSNLCNVTLHPLSRRPTIGMACVARYSEDRSLYRAVIVNTLPNLRVTYVDFGNSEDVTYDNLYDIPDKFLEHKTFAIQYGLHRVEELGPMDDNIKKLFTSLVRNESLELKVMPMNKKTFATYCELYYKERSVLQILKEKIFGPAVFPKAAALTNGDHVIIRYARDVKHFFVQKSTEETVFDAMMDRLAEFGLRAEPLDKLPNIGDCCAALHSSEYNEWYRTQVVNMIDAKNGLVEIEYVDYGIRVQLHYSKLRKLSPEFMSMPRQAVECCLSGFELIEPVPDSTRKQLEMLAEDRKSNRKTLRIELKERRTPDGVSIVDLYDDSITPPASVSAAIYKNSMPRRQQQQQPVANIANASTNNIVNNNNHMNYGANGKTNVPKSTSSSSWSDIANHEESNVVANTNTNTMNAPNGMRPMPMPHVGRDAIDGDQRRATYAERSVPLGIQDNAAVQRGTKYNTAIANNENWNDSDKMNNRGTNNWRGGGGPPRGGNRDGNGKGDNWRDSAGDSANNRCVLIVA